MQKKSYPRFFDDIGEKEIKKIISFIEKNMSNDFSVEKNGLKIAINDEILLAVACDFLDEGSTYKAEDIINIAYHDDSSTKENIKEVCETLNSIGQSFNLTRALRKK